jgi:UDP-N-acetyl-D-mannosaminuronic acid transferase (WecB/TagA/CpsF family)
VHAYLKHRRQYGTTGPQIDQVLDGYAARERAMLIEDIRRIEPSVVLVDNLTGDGSTWLRAHPEISSLLSDYQLAETVNGIDILSRVR